MQVQVCVDPSHKKAHSESEKGTRFHSSTCTRSQHCVIEEKSVGMASVSRYSRLWQTKPTTRKFP